MKQGEKLWNRLNNTSIKAPTKGEAGKKNISPYTKLAHCYSSRYFIQVGGSL